MVPLYFFRYFVLNRINSIKEVYSVNFVFGVFFSFSSSDRWHSGRVEAVQQCYWSVGSWAEVIVEVVETTLV